mgnify:CR=1 FL=1
METNEIVANACANRAFVYQYLWRAFGDAPDKTFIETTLGTAREQFELFFGADSPEMNEFEAMCAELHAALELDANATSLASDHTRLFIGPGKLPASPWESVYACGEELVFQQSTLDVRAAYHAAGFAAAGYPHVPDDHIATELAFMAALCDEAETCASSGDMQGAKIALGRQAMFLAEHLGCWTGEFAQRLTDHLPKNAGAFYAHAANLAAAACKADAAATAELLEACSK